MGDRKMGYGFRLTYLIDLEKTQTTETAAGELESTIDGQNELNIAAFFEKGLSDKSLFGVELSYTLGEFGTDGNDNDAGFEADIFQIDLYGAVSCGCSSRGIYFLPKVSYFVGGFEDAAGNELDTSGGSYAIEMLSLIHI